MSYLIIKKYVILTFKSYFDIKGQYLYIIMLYHAVKVSYSAITIKYPGLQMSDPDFKLLHLLY